MEPVVIALPGSAVAAGRLASRLGADLGDAVFRRFPDGEDYVRLPESLADREVVLVCSLQPPTERLLPLVFAAETARELGARRVGLVAPYLGYMRQDDRFHPGEAVTSSIVGAMLSRCLDWLVTVDPHLHRWSSLEQVYSIPTRVVPAAPDIASWLVASVSDPFLVGPDAESAQWVEAVARAADAPFAVLEKTRRGDRDVSISSLDRAVYRERTPVVLDDIISTGGTMIECVSQLACEPSWPALCIGTHAVFAPGAHESLLACGVRGIVTCNTIEHATNGIDVLGRLGDAAAEMLTAARAA